MSFWLSDQLRLIALIAGCAILWTAESLMPLYVYEKNRLRRVLPNVALTTLLVLTNLILSLVMAAVVVFVTQRRVGLLFLLNPPPWVLAVLGVAALVVG